MPDFLAQLQVFFFFFICHRVIIETTICQFVFEVVNLWLCYNILHLCVWNRSLWNRSILSSHFPNEKMSRKCDKSFMATIIQTFLCNKSIILNFIAPIFSNGFYPSVGDVPTISIDSSAKGKIGQIFFNIWLNHPLFVWKLCARNIYNCNGDVLFERQKKKWKYCMHAYLFRFNTFKHWTKNRFFNSRK